MASIYHVENDIDCRVKHFGKELCVAIADEDCVITLLKGRHKLTFQSLENDNDSYTIIYEVPEDGIEDFIDVHLIPLRDERVEHEAKVMEEQRRREELLRIEEENRLKHLAEEKLRREEEMAAERKRLKEEENKQRLEYLKQKEHQENLCKIQQQRSAINEKIVSSFEKVQSLIDEMSMIEDYVYDDCYWVEKVVAETKRYNLYHSDVQINDWDFERVNRFSDGLSLVRYKYKFYYIDVYGNIILGPYRYATCFVEGMAVVDDGENGLKLIDLIGNTLKSFKHICPSFNINEIYPYLFLQSEVKEDNYIYLNVYSLGEKIYTFRMGGWDLTPMEERMLK